MLPYNKPILWPIVSFRPAMCFAAIICYHQCEQETQQMKWLKYISFSLLLISVQTDPFGTIQFGIVNRSLNAELEYNSLTWWSGL